MTDRPGWGHATFTRAEWGCTALACLLSFGGSAQSAAEARSWYMLHHRNPGIDSQTPSKKWPWHPSLRAPFSAFDMLWALCFPSQLIIRFVTCFPADRVEFCSSLCFNKYRRHVSGLRALKMSVVTVGVIHLLLQIDFILYRPKRNINMLYSCTIL